MSGADYRKTNPEVEGLDTFVRERTIAILDENGVKGGLTENGSGYYWSSSIGWPIQKLVKDKIDELIKQYLKEKSIITGGRRRKTRKGRKAHKKTRRGRKH